MDIQVLFQLLIGGILFGTMYGIGAIGLSLILGTMHIMFIAQGTIIILAAYASFWLFELWGMDPYVSLILVVPASLILGIGFYQGLFRRAKNVDASLLIAFGLLVLLESLMSVIFTADTRALRTTYASNAFTVFGLRISFVRFIAFIMAILSTALVAFFLKKTLIGKAVRAASENLEYAMLVGITPYIVNTVTFALGIGLAGVAGVATATTYGFDPYSGFVFSIKAMIALALGGMGSVIGAFLGGVLLGVVEAYGSFFISSGWADVISYAVFLLVLMFKPEGLFNREYTKL
jgi:branched-chain amino acid transport system permease protein